ncbi:unnamed protein product [Paramecium pentaurelia]|uniref:F-box domain-containing protein n=1 Tax=Paramecium pentaurelia TaxID=43138 RepID=A0A8S1XYC6_9CILI|nr:unnamed protein product [Paramecium pentaurelia]
MDQQEQSLGLLGELDYRLIQQISKYLLAKEVLNLSLTNSFFRDTLMKFKRIEVSSENKVVVKDDNISLYLEMDISEIYDKIEVIMAIVETKDQGWASASYSTSWVTLTLFNNPVEYQTHGVMPYEKIIYENFREKNYAERKLTITETIAMDNTKKQQYETLLGLCRKGEYKKLGIVQKCQYPGWECYLKSGKIIVWYRE